jgi:mesencephalic astrocyte-derived neurotrophic factor
MEPIKKSVSQPFSLKLPKKKVCQRLKKSNPEICEVKNSVKVEKEASAQDVTKLRWRTNSLNTTVNVMCPIGAIETIFPVLVHRVKQLKAILAERGVECEGCIEKDDFVKRVLATAHMADL